MFNTLNYCAPKTLIICTLVLLSACAPPVKVAVEERKVLTVRQQSEEIGGQLVRIVQSGDTLYAIAFASNLDVNELAAWNNISDTSRLLVGQRVRLTKPIGFVAKPAIKPKAKLVKAQTSNANGARSKSVVRKPQSRSLKKNQSVTSTSPSSTSAPRPSSSSAAPKITAGVSWSWPLSGKVIRRFSPSSTQQGIDILGRDGQQIMVSAPGEVVYVGNSLKGYGNLIIIKHNESFLSAYAHNKKILVSEGQKVTSRQVIGSVGINNRRESALHFQIRRKGKPVNPLSYLSTSFK